jgi:nucleolar protein 56
MLTVWFGTFLFNNDGKIEKSILFPKSADEIGARLQAISHQEILAEERKLVEGYNDISHIAVTEERLKGLFTSEVELDTTLTAPQPAEFGYDYKLLHAAALARSKEQLVGEIKADKHIIHAINSINELTQTANLMSERLHEWYGLHWPEFTNRVSEKEYLELIIEHGTRSEITTKADPEDTSESLGGELTETDIEAIKGLANILKEIYSERERLEKYVKTKVEDIAPNASRVAGPLITAKLIALTGGLERLSRVSASTIQLLGAEKALFRHLKDGSSPPKHGVIFQHPYLHSAPYWQRGKIARALASKISIAVKVDYYKGEFRGDDLEAQLKVRIDVIRKQFSERPAKPKKKFDKSSQIKPSGQKKQKGKRRKKGSK